MPPRRRVASPSPSSSQSNKRSKPSDSRVLAPFSANTNGGIRTASLGAQSRPKPKDKARDIVNNDINHKNDCTKGSLSAYMPTLVECAPPPQSETKENLATENPPADSSSGRCATAKLSLVEQQFLKDISSSNNESGKPLQRVVATLSDNEGSETLQDGLDDDGESEGELHSLAVEDVSTNSKSNKERRRGGKVLLSEFDNRKLATLAKRCVCVATFVENMCPEDPLFTWDIFTEELERWVSEGRGVGLVASFNVLNEDPERRETLIRFCNLPGVLSENEIVASVGWLLKDRRYHHSNVNLQERTTDSLPFRSELIVLILRGYFIDGKPKQDRITVSRLHREERIPLPLIAMCAVLIGHTLQEYASGYKQEIALSTTNLANHFRAVMNTMTKLQEKAPAYVDLLQTELYHKMTSAGPEVIPSQTYDYAALDLFAKEGSILTKSGGSMVNADGTMSNSKSGD